MRWVTEYLEYLGILLINGTQVPKTPKMLNLAYILRMSFHDRTLRLLGKTPCYYAVVVYIVIILNVSGRENVDKCCSVKFATIDPDCNS